MVVEAEYEEIGDDGEELALPADDSLPWLESDEEEEDAGGIDTAQVIGFAAVLVALLVLVVGGIWYFTNRAGDGEFVADGSTIAAPDTPVKVRPDDPGGKQFEGTGNVAPVVGEGGTREGRVATPEAELPPLPGESAEDAAAPRPKPEAKPEPAAPQAPAAGADGVAVQLAAYSSRARAEQGWNELSRRTDVLSGLRYRVVEGRIDIGTVYRLQALAADRASADRLCAALKADGLDCQVKP
ncbi:Sporulation related domain-containing protein [Erythrobacter sp. HL-111]|nr:MAG: Sporulation related domain [Erythrobacteraceae bacterium HL-111]SDT11372.1 Sporulation related domain-containing protein [Erythrobacter sp. HL-111]